MHHEKRLATQLADRQACVGGEHVWRIENGLAVEMFAAPLDPYAVDAFFAAAA